MEAAGTDSICDTYAMIVTGDGDVWLCVYTQFPIVRIRNGAYPAWTLGVSGAHALAVREPRVLLFGDYEQRARARIVTLRDDGTAAVEREITLVDDRGRPLVGAGARGVGGSLYAFDDRRVLVVDAW